MFEGKLKEMDLGELQRSLIELELASWYTGKDEDRRKLLEEIIPKEEALETLVRKRLQHEKLGRNKLRKLLYQSQQGTGESINEVLRRLKQKNLLLKA